MENLQKDISILVDHFFRHESGKMVAVLTKIFGSQNLDLAEDVVQDSLVEALEHWPYHAIPDNPSAWLFRVAKNKALNIIHREKYKQQYSKEAAYLLKSGEWSEPADLFFEQKIQDDQLRMMFTCCHPSISADSQVSLTLKTLCGFGIPEIAHAFLTTETNISKRLVRARQTIRDENIPFEVPQGQDLVMRVQTVLETIYLIFNEAYSASRGNDIIRFDLCQEAIRLAQMLENEKTIKQKGNIYALLSLMFLNASRFRARQDQEGNLLTMAEQNRLLWDRKLQASGFEYLQKATENPGTSTYFILAAISANYCLAPDYDSTNWKNILFLYDSLIELDHSPVVLLNRAIVLSKIAGAEKGLHELELLKNEPQIKSYHLFYSTQAEFFIELGQHKMAIRSLQEAVDLAPLESIRDLLKKKIGFCKEKISFDSSF
jgi:RNA polymerase sigma factor (sigma-70 family)